MTNHRITAENSNSFNGRKVHISYGAMYPTLTGEVVGSAMLHGTPNVLIFTDEGEYTLSSLLIDSDFKGVGVHLMPETS